MPPETRPPATKLTTHLERAVAPHFVELHASSVFQALLAGRVTKERYEEHLQSLFTMHRCLERALAAAKHLPGFDAPAFRREDALLRDLRMLGGRLPLRANPALDQFESLVQLWVRPPCVALIGSVAAFELLRPQSLRLVKPIAAALDLKIAPRSGLDYLIDGSDHHVRRVRHLQNWINTQIREAESAREVLTGAVRTMHSLVQLHQDPEEPK
jgi:heme oxygenase